MVKNFLTSGRNLLYSRQASILSAATIIMIMIAASRFLGLVRNRTFVHFFPPQTLDTFLAAFQLPDMFSDIFISGVMSSAFIPVFSSHLGRGEEKLAWKLAGITLNIILLFFLVFSIVIYIFAHPIYSLVAPGFTPEQVAQTVSFTRLLLVAQMFFAASYVLTASLESNQRFLAPAVAPLFYNAGIIVVTLLLAPKIGLYAPVLGAVLGAFLHFLIQFPLAWSLGFRPKLSLNLIDEDTRRIAHLAFPRIIEMSFFRIKQLADLFFASLIAGGLTYFKFGDALAGLSVGLFGLPIAKASLPALSRLGAVSNMDNFKATFASSFKEILFLVIPASIFLGVLRIPVVRLAFGADQFDWQDTVQTGYVVSSFAVGSFAYALSLLLSRSFYALQDTFTPVKVSVFTILANISLAAFFMFVLRLPIWGLALSYAIAGIVQIIILLVLLGRKIGGFGNFGLVSNFVKLVIAGLLSGSVMFILLKILDRSVWDKKLSFLGSLGLGLPTTFDRFVLDTRYTMNLIYITLVVALIGFLVYIFVAWILKIEELKIVVRVLARIGQLKKATLPAEAANEGETITPPHTNGS